MTDDLDLLRALAAIRLQSGLVIQRNGLQKEVFESWLAAVERDLIAGPTEAGGLCISAEVINRWISSVEELSAARAALTRALQSSGNQISFAESPSFDKWFWQKSLAPAQAQRN